MENKTFLYKLYPPRPTFHLDQTEEEGKVMQEHMKYWAALTAQKTSIVYGPVFDPNGVYSMAVIEVANNEDVLEVANQDPAVSSGVCSYEIIPMQIGMSRN